MKNKKIYRFVFLLLVLGCKDKYNAPVVSPSTGYLVVEGNVNSGNGTTTITLSRTTKLDSLNTKYEQGAIVKVEGDDNSSYSLAETGVGQYTADLNLTPTVKYKVSITTSNGKQYVSDFAPVKSNPPIDSISWQREHGDGVGIYINTHDPQNNTRYYQWEFVETWEFHSHFVSSIQYFVDNSTRPPTYSAGYRNALQQPDSSIYVCYKTVPSSNIFIGSTAKLSKDVVFLPVVFIPHGDWKLSVLYSIEVKQHSLTKEGYEFLERMKKNTETTGSVFDAQPSELNGNIHCITDPKEPVIGYINISPVYSKRIFISNSELPGWGYDESCFRMEIENISDSIKAKGLGLTPTYPNKLGMFGAIVTFFASSVECVDCTLRGTNVKPSFWP